MRRLTHVGDSSSTVRLSESRGTRSSHSASNKSPSAQVEDIVAVLLSPRRTIDERREANRQRSTPPFLFWSLKSWLCRPLPCAPGASAIPRRCRPTPDPSPAASEKERPLLPEWSPPGDEACCHRFPRMCVVDRTTTRIRVHIGTRAVCTAPGVAHLNLGSQTAFVSDAFLGAMKVSELHLSIVVVLGARSAVGWVWLWPCP